MIGHGGSVRAFGNRGLRPLLVVLGLVLVVGVVALIVTVRGHGGPSNSTSSFSPGSQAEDSCGAPVSGAASVTPKSPPSLAPVTRSGTTLEVDGKPWRFSGVNEFWLGLDGDHRDENGPEYPSHKAIRAGIAAASRLCARVIRSISLGVSVGNERSIEPALAQFNDGAFDTIDYSVAVARSYGIRLVIPFTDAYHYYSGGQHTFTNWLGFTDLPGETASTDGKQRYRERQFFTDSRVIGAFQNYLRHYLDHVNKYTGVRLGSDPTVAMWELGNELKDVPPAWSERIARFIRKLSPQTLIGFSGSVTGPFDEAVRRQPTVDVYDGHFYPPDPDSMSMQSAYVSDADRAYIVGEYPLYDDQLDGWFARLTSNSSVSGDLAWSLLPTVDGKPEEHDDGYTFHNPPTSAKERGAVRRLLAHSKAMIASS